MTVIDFLRDVGKNFRLGTMLAKDTVARRLNSEEGISFTEFSYQVLQGNDFLHLFDEYHCTLELGGSDQWGNLTSGLDLIHKVRGVDVNVFTSPIITDASGKKFSKVRGQRRLVDATMLSRTSSTSSGSTARMWRWKPAEGVHLLPKAEIERLVEESKTTCASARPRRSSPGRSPASCMARPLPRPPLTLPVRCSTRWQPRRHR